MKKSLFIAFTLSSLSVFAQNKNTNPLLDSNSPSPFFVVQNIATEKMRVYQRCFTSPDCPHHMIMETDMVVGRTSGDKARSSAQPFLTWVGHYKISRLVKFYEDAEAHYPSWFDPNYPAVPQDAGASDWMGKEFLPNPSKNVYRGAFGWWAAMVTPNANAQWIHGTYGWGRDGDKFIQLTRNLFVNLVGDPRSSGCTRLENQAVAWARHHLPIGTDIFRIYALEAYADKNLTDYQDQREGRVWEWILTKPGTRKDNVPSADKAVVLSQLDKKQILASDILEEGSYKVDQYPDGLGYSGTFLGLGASAGTSGDTYDLGRKKMKGVFLVDQGRFVNYQHPENLSRGGFNKPLPAFVNAQVQYVLADPYNSGREFGDRNYMAPTSRLIPQGMSAEEYIQLRQVLESRKSEIKGKL